jgi:uncharacterized protein YjbI with pentapeptide repeats
VWRASIGALIGAIVVALGIAIAVGIPLVRPPEWYLNDFQGPVSEATNSYRSSLGPIFATLIHLVGALFVSAGLCALYRLHLIAERNPELLWTVVDIIAEFVRGRCDTTGQGSHQDLRTAIETCGALVSGTKRLLSSTRLSPVDTDSFRSANFGGVDFRNVDLTGVIFRNINLNSSNFDGAHLRRAEFHSCSLNRATFVRANLEFAVFRNCSAQVNLCHASAVAARFEACTLDGAWMDDANLESAGFARSLFGFVSARRARFVRANLARAFLTGSEIFDGADFTEAQLPSEQSGLRSIRPSQFNNGPAARPMWFPCTDGTK